MELIRLEDIRKTYYLGEVAVPVLHGISLSIQAGEMVALMGASGSGKTTLMNILGCLDHPTSGRYWLAGQEMSQLSPNQRALVRSEKIGFVFQNFNLLARTSALQNVLMPLSYSGGLSSPEKVQWAMELLQRMGLADQMDYYPSQMSGGQQQRVAIARALVNRPILLLADEPTGNLDSQTSVEILRLFQQLHREGLTILLVTHDPQVAAYAHRIVRIADGRIVDDQEASSLEDLERAAGGRAIRLHPMGTSGASPAPEEETGEREVSGQAESPLALAVAEKPRTKPKEKQTDAQPENPSLKQTAGLLRGLGSVAASMLPSTSQTALAAMWRPTM
jgi:macrolide transport system ATP-binding/permease protein